MTISWQSSTRAKKEKEKKEILKVDKQRLVSLVIFAPSKATNAVNPSHSSQSVAHLQSSCRSFHFEPAGCRSGDITTSVRVPVSCSFLHVGAAAFGGERCAGDFVVNSVGRIKCSLKQQ